jgi:hypothetical protein
MPQAQEIKLRYLGLSPLPDSKLILLTMAHYGLTEISFRELDKVLNCPLNEVDVGRMALSADRININKQMNMITLSDEWKKLVEDNKNVQLQNGLIAVDSRNDTLQESGDLEASESGDLSSSANRT